MKYCPRCGFAMSELDKTCQRCATRPSPSKTRPPADRPPLPSKDFPWAKLTGAMLGLVALGVSAALLAEPVRIWRAAALTTWGAQLASGGDFDGAISAYNRSAELCPDLCVTHVDKGLAILRIDAREGLSDARIEKLMDAATMGWTAELDRADDCFYRGIKAAQSHPELLSRVRFEFIQSGERIAPDTFEAATRLGLALTAIVRIGAAENAGQQTQAQGWADAAKANLRETARLNPSAKEAVSLWRLLASAGY